MQKSNLRCFADPAVAAVFSGYAPVVREKLFRVRKLIFLAASRNPAIGHLDETLKWGQPSYLTSETKSGSTIRIDALNSTPDGYAVYFHCQTDLVETFRKRFGGKFRYEGNRALIFSGSDPIPAPELEECITAALTYHLAKRISRMPMGELINKFGR